MLQSEGIFSKIHLTMLPQLKTTENVNPQTLLSEVPHIQWGNFGE